LPHSLEEFDRRFGEVFVVNIFYLQLREYINEWRKQRGKEEEELKRLKDKQAKRKEIRYSTRKITFVSEYVSESRRCFA
jgi:hypothetical protein